MITYGAMATLEHVVGPRIRALREARGLSLRDLATATDVSHTALSQIERGEASPTLAIAARIAGGLGLTLSGLLRLDDRAFVTVVRRGDRRPRRRGAHRWEEHTPSLPGQRVSVSTHTLGPKGRTGGPDDPPIHAPGSREIVLVQDGRLDLVIDGDRYGLGEGDSATFDADLPHHFENPGRAPATFVAVVTAGLREA